MLFAPFFNGFVLWILVNWLFKDEMDWRACVIWAAVSVLVGWGFEHLTAKLILPSDLQPDIEGPFVWTVSSTHAVIMAIAGLVGTMLTIYGVIWHLQGRIPLDKAIILFLCMGAARLVFIIIILSGPDTLKLFIL